ncbi:hypothetical protein K502DRAFT_345542 [Neoconidiobolus thromboides FSU 785]|nr:hypothetical protein K502DRAFT_345542 [Neoconidiobolus thromboides FSU 785]
MQTPSSDNKLDENTSYTEITKRIHYLLSFDDFRQIIKKIKALETSVLKSDLSYLFIDYVERFHAEIEQLDYTDTEVNKMEKKLIKWLKLIQGYYWIVCERFLVKEAKETKEYLFKEEDVNRILDTFFISLIYFVDKEVIRITLNILEKIHLSKAITNHYALFDRVLFSIYYKKYEMMETLITKNYDIKVKFIFERVLELLNDASTQVKNQNFLIYFFKLQRKGMVNYCCYEKQAIKSLFEFLNNKINELSYTSEFDKEPIMFSIIRKPFDDSLGKDDEDIKKKITYKEEKMNQNTNKEEESKLDQKNEKLVNEMMNLVNNCIELSFQFRTETEIYDEIVKLFLKVSYHQVNIYNFKKMKMNDRFIKFIVLPMLKALKLVFIMERSEAGEIVTCKKIHFKQLTFCLLNLSTHLLNHNINKQNYDNLQQVMLKEETVEDYYFDLVLEFYKLLKNVHLKSMELQHQFLIFDESIIYLKILLNCNDLPFNELERINRDYYSIYLQFYQVINCSNKSQMISKEIKFNSKTNELFQTIILIINKLTESSGELNVLKYRPFGYNEKEGNFLVNYNLLPMFSIVVIRLFENNSSSLNFNYLVGMLNLIYKLMTEKTIEEFNYCYPNELKLICSKCYNILYLHCTKQDDTQFKQQSNYSKLMILTYSSNILQIIIQKYQFNEFIKELYLPQLFEKYKLIDTCPNELDFNSINPVFNLFSCMFQSFVFRNNLLKERITIKFIYLLAHTFMLWTQRPTIIDKSINTNENEKRVNYYDSIIDEYQLYGKRILDRIINLLDCFIKDKEWKQLFVCCYIDENIDEKEVYFINELTKPGFYKLIQIPKSYMLYKDKNGIYQNNNTNNDYIISIINPIYQITLCYKYDIKLSILTCNYLLNLLTIPSAIKYIINYTNYIANLSYELINIYISNNELYNVINKIIIKLLTDENQLVNILKNNLINKWYFNIIKHIDIINIEKVKEIVVIITPIINELINIIIKLIELYSTTENQRSKVKLNQLITIYLSYCCKDSNFQSFFITGDLKFIEGNSSCNLKYQIVSKTPYDTLLDLIFNFKEEDEVEDFELESKRWKMESGVYAINYHAFLNSEKIYKELQSILKQVKNELDLSIYHMSVEYEKIVHSKSKQQVKFQCKNSQKDSEEEILEFQMPLEIIEFLSPILAVSLQFGGIESATKIIKLPIEYFNTLNYLNDKIFNIINHQFITLKSNQINMNFLSNEPEDLQLSLCVQFFELADIYEIRFLLLYSINILLNQLLNAINSINPSQSLYQIYKLYQEKNEFPLLQGLTEKLNLKLELNIDQFLVHFITLFLIEFMNEKETEEERINDNDDDNDNNDNNDNDDNEIYNNEINENTNEINEILEPKEKSKEIKNQLLIYEFNPILFKNYWKQLYFNDN